MVLVCMEKDILKMCSWADSVSGNILCWEFEHLTTVSSLKFRRAPNCVVTVSFFHIHSSPDPPTVLEVWSKPRFCTPAFQSFQDNPISYVYSVNAQPFSKPGCLTKGMRRCSFTLPSKQLMPWIHIPTFLRFCLAQHGLWHFFPC